MPPSADVAVVGAGVVGLSCAWRAAQAGLRVDLFDPEPVSGATWAAAGMLAPVTEAHFTEGALLALNLASARAWPSFAEELEDAAGSPVGFRTAGTLLLAADAGDLAVLDALAEFLARSELPADRLSGRDARRLEPLLAPGLRGALFAPDDHQVDNRLLGAALLLAVERAGVRVVRQPATVLLERGRASGVATPEGDRFATGTVVVAAGAWSPQVQGLPGIPRLPVRPVKGQILRLRAPAGGPVPERTVRALVAGRSCYLVPRAGGQVVVGATVEEQGFDTSVRAGAVADLLDDARAVLPVVAEYELEEAVARLRPGSPDNAPLLGPWAVPGLLVATGHFRNGILLAPVTATAILAVLEGHGLPPEARPFAADRFCEVAGGQEGGAGG